MAGPRPGAPAHRGVLRERRQGGHRGGDAAAPRPALLRRPLHGRPRRPDRLLAGPAGPDHRADGAARRLEPLRADRLGPGLRDGRRAPARAGLARRGGLLHVRQDLQRGRVRLPALRARVRHQQPARLLEHVPRVDLGGARRDDRHRQGLGDRRRYRARRPDRHRRPEPGHQPPPDAERPRDRQAERREDHLGQPAARGRAGEVQEPAEGAGHRRSWHRPRRPAPADPAQRRPRAVPGARRAAGGVGRGRPRLRRHAHRRVRRWAPTS